MTEPRELSYLVPANVLAEVNTALTVLETYGPAVSEALRQLDRATTVAWKAVNLVEVTDEEWQLVKRAIGIDRRQVPDRRPGPAFAAFAQGDMATMTEVIAKRRSGTSPAASVDAYQRVAETACPDVGASRLGQWSACGRTPGPSRGPVGASRRLVPRRRSPRLKWRSSRVPVGSGCGATA